MYALLEVDEEVDTGVFTAYLRAQSDADLLDILLHLDPERYPARVDAAQRETMRRRVLPVPFHTAEERCIRGVALAALALAGVTVLLTVMLTSADVAGPPWPTDAQMQNGTMVSTVMRLGLLGILRAVVVISGQLALGTLALLTLAVWLALHARRRSTRPDVKRLVLLACLVLFAAFLLAAVPFSAVPTLYDPSLGDATFEARLLTLLWPY